VKRKLHIKRRIIFP